MASPMNMKTGLARFYDYWSAYWTQILLLVRQYEYQAGRKPVGQAKRWSKRIRKKIGQGEEGAE